MQQPLSNTPLYLSLRKFGAIAATSTTAMVVQRDAELRLTKTVLLDNATGEAIETTYQMDDGYAFTVSQAQSVLEQTQVGEDLRLHLLSSPHTARILAERAQTWHSGAVAVRGELPS